MTIRSSLLFVVAMILVASAFDGHPTLRTPYVAFAKDATVDRVKPRKRPKNQALSELDPLRQIKFFKGRKRLKEVGPNVIIAIDRSPRMSYDVNGVYYDPERWDKNASYDSKKEIDPKVVAAGLGVSAGARYYRRTYAGLTRKVAGTNTSFDADAIAVVDELDPEYANFYFASRLGMARDGLAQAIDENMFYVRFGVVASRQGDDTSWPGVGNGRPLDLKGGSQSGLEGDLLGKKWKVTFPMPEDANMDARAESADVLVKAEASDSSAKALVIMQSDPAQPDGLKPFGLDEGPHQDSPITNLLTDTRAEVVRVLDKDTDFLGCRNTAVILVVGGSDGHLRGKKPDPVGVAATFKTVTVKGITRRVPIYVIAMGPAPGDVRELQDIASVSGGEYIEAADANAVARAANRVVQALHGRSFEFDSQLTSDFQSASPVVGTVNLSGASDIDGAPLPSSSITSGGAVLEQHSNTLVTSGFRLPGFEAVIKGFRVFQPQADSSEASGYRFVRDGTPLWVGHIKGSAKDGTGPHDATSRNIYTHLPGVGILALTSDNAAALAPYLRQDTTEEAAELIEFVRQLPLGAPLNSTPVLMNPPSLDPAPDGDYAEFKSARADRRSLVFFGGSDGMLHALDGRLGVEVWSFVPFNLLPKLPTLIDGQGVVEFEYFVAASPKVADIKVNGAWRTHLIVGEGPGGTFYQAFDVSDAGLGIGATSDSEAAVVDAFASPNVIPLKWSFPDYAKFDHTVNTRETPYGDISPSASLVEKSVGETWSTPAVGQPGDATAPFVVVMGSGYLDRRIESQMGRSGASAGHALYVLDAGTGAVRSSVDVGYSNDGDKSKDDDSDDSSSSDDKSSDYRNGLKNSLTADPALIGSGDTAFFDRIYIGDTRGHMWRFPIGKSALLSPPVLVYDAAKEHPIFASAGVADAGAGQTHVFFATGSDMLGYIKKLEKFVLVGILDKGGNAQCFKRDRSCEKFEIVLQKADGRGGDERPTSGPALAGGTVFFSTTTEMADDPCAPAEATLYATTFLGGPAYDTTGDGRVDSKDSVVLRSTFGRATAPFVADEHLYLGVDDTVEVFGDPERFNNGLGKGAARLLSWREVR